MSMPPAPPPAAAPKKLRPRWASSVVVVFGPAVLALLVLVATAGWLVTTSTGLRVVAALATTFVPGLTLSGVEGSLGTGVRIERFELTRPGWAVAADRVEIELRQWSLRQRTLDMERVGARRLQIDWVASGGPSTPPSSLGLPFDIDVRRGRVHELAIGARGAAPTLFHRVEFGGRMNPQGIEVPHLAGEFERTGIQAQARIDATAPFATDARAQLSSTLQGRTVLATASATGSLQQLRLQLSADDSAARARVDAVLLAFAEVPFERLEVDIETFDPALWMDGVPSMQLRARADLAPTTLADGTWSVSGPFSAENSTAGPIDRERLPVRSLRGMLTWAAQTLRLDIDRAEGVRGVASGALTWSSADGVKAAARFSGVDASTLHSRMVVTNASGQIDYSLLNGEQRFVGSARNTGALPLSADLDASVRAQVLEVARARLSLGEGRADLRGRFELAGARSARFSGSFKDLDLARLVRGIDTRLNGTLEVDGRLQQPLSGRATFALAESRIAGRPISGRGHIEAVGTRLDADVELRSGTARLTALGGIGAGRELRLDLVAPELETLLPGYGGRIDARANLTGELDSARIDATAAGKNLRLPGGHRIGSVMASFRGGVAATEPFALTVELAQHTAPRGPEQSLAGATLIGRGTTASATLELNGATGAQQPVRIIASGGLSDGAWRGSLVAAEVGAPVDLLMRSPTPLMVSLDAVALGPADFLLHSTRFTNFELQRKDGRWRTSGQFEGLQPQALDAQARAPRRVVRSGAGDRVPLTLTGRWDLEYADAVNGIAVIERSGGDIYSGVDALSPIGVSDVGAALSVHDNRVTGNVYMRGRALGKIDAAIDAYVDPAAPGGRLLAQERPFRVVVDASLPDLSWIGPLIGDNVQFGGSGSINATVGGTPADPTSTGTMRGEALRLAWVDQAVRMENGRLDAVLDDGVLVINELLFSGNPRVAPLDKRALEGLDSNRPFEVRAVGRVALRSLAGSIGVQATQLPVLQRADRWMVVSGNGGITLSPQRAELYAKLTVDGAYIDFDGLRGGRSLPSDVVVTRAGAQRKASAAAPVDVTLDVQGSLGRRFYIAGAGLEARLDGAVSLSGRPSQLRAEGSVRAVDGVFAGYGQRLRIERGIVTFQGPIDNPSLNVLAVRAGLPVEVGVAISGTAQRPYVRLHSDPSMSDTEKLNWLVLGRPPGASDGNDRAMLSAAASALFAGQADSASAGIMRTFGIDQITLQSGQSNASLLPRETVAGRLRSSGMTTTSSAASDFLAVGKRINDDLYLSFEQALSGAEYFVALNYRLTRHLSLIARAGSTNALDLVYSIAFD
jgi:translocation and assembly module TamB